MKAAAIDLGTNAFRFLIRDLDEKNNYVGQITSGAFSPDFNKVVALGMINKDCANNKNRLFTLINGKKYLIHIHEKPFI